jgi:hypothetical protein
MTGRSSHRSGAAEPATLTDRFAVAFSSGVASFLAVGLIWFGLGSKLGAFVVVVPFAFVVLFSIVMAILGFALMVNPIASVLSWLLHALMKLF